MKYNNVRSRLRRDILEFDIQGNGFNQELGLVYFSREIFPSAPPLGFGPPGSDPLGFIANRGKYTTKVSTYLVR